MLLPDEMNYPIKSIYLFVFCTLTLINVCNTKLSAISDVEAFSISRMYFEEGNSDQPHEMDKALKDPTVRQQICQEITNSDAFMRYALYPIPDADVYKLLEQRSRPSTLFRRLISAIRKPPEGLDILDQIYDPTHSYEYTNEYKIREIEVTKFFPKEYKEPIEVPKKECVFVCLLKDKPFRRLVPLFVSKEYNVNGGLRAHRYAFLKWIQWDLDEHEIPHNKLLLVEASAEIHQHPNFNVETHYLEVREHRKPAATARYDPVCKTNDLPLEYSQFFRLCAIIFSASYFKEKHRVKYPRRVHSNNSYYERVIGFGTDEGKKTAGKKRYRELTLRCYVMLENAVKEFYVSRAYYSHQVFVYLENKTDRKLYLEGLFTGVSIIHEKLKFGCPPN